MFDVPSDPERLKAWAQAIPRKDRTLSTKDVVCSKHFTDDTILKKRYFSELGGELLLDVPKGSVLSEAAISCVFPSSPAQPLLDHLAQHVVRPAVLPTVLNFPPCINYSNHKNVIRDLIDPVPN